MTTDTEALITSLYNGLVLRDPSAAETTYWKEQLDLGLTTPVSLVLLGATAPEFTHGTLPIAMMFEAAFGYYATTAELTAWRMAYDHGLTLADIGQNFILSKEFSSNNPALTTTEDYIQAMASAGLGRSATQAELDILVPLIDSGALNYGYVLQHIVESNGREVKVGMAMLSAGLNGVAPETAGIDSLDASIPVAINTIIDTSPFFSSATSSTLSLTETDGVLDISGPLTADMTLNLSALTVTVDNVNQTLASGDLSAVTSVDATDLSGNGKVVFVGSTGVETYAASPAGDSIQGAGGADQLTGGAGIDSFIFETTAAANGIDVVADFQLDPSDILDFSAFLNVTNTTNIAPVDADSTGEAAWANGDVLVVVGYELTTSAAIAGLFGANSPFAAPTARGKAVVIATDIVGDAGVWYLLNQVTATSITEDELAQVAVLCGINNLDLVSFTADNFA